MTQTLVEDQGTGDPLEESVLIQEHIQFICLEGAFAEGVTHDVPTNVDWLTFEDADGPQLIQKLRGYGQKWGSRPLWTYRTHGHGA